MQVAEHTIDVAGAAVFYRSASPAPGSDHAPPLYLHGAPSSSEDWVALLQRTGGFAPDLLGFGRSSKAGFLHYTLAGLANFIGLYLDRLDLERVALVGHGWGAGAGLVYALRDPTRVQRLVLIDALPLLEGFAWHGLGRVMRTPGIGEVAMGATTRGVLRRILRRGFADGQALPAEWFDGVWSHFDQGTQRAVLRLHRSAPEPRLVEAGARLETLTMPTLVIWGERDPWFTPVFADRYGGRLQRAEVWRVDDAGHWPWLELPAVTDRIEEFVRGI